MFDSLRTKARVFLILFQSVSAVDGAIHTQKDGVENKEAPWKWMVANYFSKQASSCTSWLKAFFVNLVNLENEWCGTFLSVWLILEACLIITTAWPQQGA